MNLGDPSSIVDEKSPLTERGRLQAAYVGKRCAQLPIETLIVSTMTRTRETADIIRQHLPTIPIEYSTCFIERTIPDELIGRSRSSVQEELTAWANSFFENGVTFRSFRERAGRALLHLGSHPSANILVVTHGFFMRMMLAYVMFGGAITPDEFKKFVRATRTDNTGISILTNEPVRHHDIDPDEHRWRIRVFNDHAHLADPS